MPLHLLIGYNYLKPLLGLSPTGLWLLLDIHSQDMKWAVVVLKFYFGSEQACVDAKAIFDGKNANLVAANPSGYMAHPLTIRDPISKAGFERKRSKCPSFTRVRVPCASYPAISMSFYILLLVMSLCARNRPPKILYSNTNHARTRGFSSF